MRTEARQKPDPPGQMLAGKRLKKANLKRRKSAMLAGAALAGADLGQAYPDAMETRQSETGGG